MVYGFISHELEQLRHPNFAWYLDLTLTTLSQNLVSQKAFIQKCSKLENQLKITLIEKLIYHEAQELRHPSSKWYSDLIITALSQSLVS